MPARIARRRMTHEPSSLAKLIDRVGAFVRACDEVPDAEAVFNELALEVFRFQFAHNGPLRSLCERRGVTPDTVTDWRQVPALPTAAFKEFELTCLAAADRTVVFHSSGTTAQRPSRHFHSAGSLGLYTASLAPWFRRHLLATGPDDAATSGRPQILALTPPPEAAPHSSLVYMLDQARREFGGQSSCFAGRAGDGGEWNIDPAWVLDWLRRQTVLNQRVILCGTAFNFVHLLDWMISRDERLLLHPGSAVMETGGYKGRSRELPRTELHQFISQRLGVIDQRIVCEYGMCELGSQAYDRVAGGADNRRRFRFPPWARARIISPDTGREESEGRAGLIQIFDLANVCSSLGVQTEDLAIRHADGFELIGRATLANARGCSLMSV